MRTISERALMARKNDITRYWLFSVFVLLIGLIISSVSFAAATPATTEATVSPNLTINLVDGTKNDAPMANTRIDIKEILADGAKKWRKRIETDDKGKAAVFLEGLGSGRTYLLYARSTFNKRSKVLQVDSAGRITFRVGTPLLKVTLRDAETGKIIPDTRVTAVQVEAGKKDKWLGSAKSDEFGKLSLDIPALSEGATIRLRADKVYNNMNAYSPLIHSAGTIDFTIGDVRVKVLDSRNDQPLVNQVVTIYMKPAQGKNQWYGKATTDGNGLLRLNLKGVDADSTIPPNYILKTRSPFNKKYKHSQLINRVGEHVFRVGTPLLNVTLIDASNRMMPVANKEIRAYRIINGKRKSVGRATTNTQGLAQFDIPELSEEGAIVSLRTKVFNTGMWAQSQDITSPGDVNFAVGTMVVTVKDGSVANGKILPGLKVNLREVVSAEKTRGVANLVTDEQGKLRLTLPMMEKGKSYVLRAKNPDPNISRYKYSQIINKTGNHEFIVGTELLKVTLANALNQAPLAGKRVDVYQDRSPEKAKWLGRLTTNAQGKGVVDVPLLAENGHTFFLRARQPYDAGNVYSKTFKSGVFTLDFPVGKTPVALSDKDSGKPISGQRIDAYEKLSTGKLKWRGRGNTDAQGIVHFDLAQLELGHTHVFRTKNPFGKNKRFYSALVSAEGPVDFAISVDEDSPLDLKAPVAAITSPVTGSDVGETGFDLMGTATDNEAIDKVVINLNDGKTNTLHNASYDANTHAWRLYISAEHLTTGANLQVSVTAIDKAQNENTVSASYQVIADKTPPGISITSPSEGDDIPATGFIVNGFVNDDTGVKSLHAQVQDSDLGLIVERDVDVSANGGWALAINNGQLTEGGSVLVTLTATDVADRTTVVNMNLNVVAATHEARHMINRITFGATADLLEEIRSNGVSAYLNAQLAPDAIDDSKLDAILADHGEPFSAEELQVYQLTHMIHSRRQLREVMAWFWENHFNTDINKDGNGFEYELAEHKAFRANALGNFRTLLDISAKSPAMLIYLDSVLNVRRDANENYAREVMELYTCGVDGCYTQDDVEALAEILTGWQVKNDAFFFNASDHTPGGKVFQGVAIPEGGVQEGNTALDMLAQHPATAHYICSKLIEVFVSDTPDAGLNARCANTFRMAADDSDQIAQVLRTILTSPEFNSPENFDGKIKSPVELAVGVVRSLDARGSYENLPGYIRRMGLRLFQNPVPTGWDEKGSAWINSALLQERTRFVNQLARATGKNDTTIDPVAFFQSRNLETAEGIVAYLLDLLGGDIWDDLERQTALDILNQNGAFDINAATADAQLRELIGTVLSFPEYNYQ